jgi:CrcB protein
VTTALLVVLGAMLGGPARLWVDALVQRALGASDGSRLPLGTAVVNIAGSLLLGAVVGSAIAPGPAVLLGAGFCGAFTTFSTFAAQTDVLLAGGRRRLALGNVALNFLACIGAAALGFAMAG